MATFKHNSGHISRPNFADGTFGRVRNIIWSLPDLSEGARLLLAWVDSRPPDWIPIVKFICGELRWGKDKWRRVRDELDKKGWLRHAHVRTSDQYTDHSLEFDLSQLESLAQNPRIGRDGTSLATSRRSNRLSHDAPPIRPSKQDEKNRKKTTTIRTANKPAAPGGGGGGGVDETGVDEGTFIPASTITGTVGSQLKSLLKAPEIRKLNDESVGLSAEQAEAVVKEVSRQVTGGKVRSVVGLSVTLTRAAARGELAVKGKEQEALATAGNSEAVWRQRAARAGWSVLHPTGGRLTVETGAKAWRNENGQLIAGQDGLKLWDKVESGALVLHEPQVRRRVA